MSDNNVNGITGADVATTTGIIGATVGIGQYIINDYVITIAATEGDYGYTMTITRGTETQTVTLYGLTQQQYDAMLGYLQQAQEAAQSAQTADRDAQAALSRALNAALAAADSESNAAEHASESLVQAGFALQSANDARAARIAAQSAQQQAQAAQTAAETAKTSAQTAQAAAEAARIAAETAETSAGTSASQASQSATNAAQSATDAQHVLDSIPEDYTEVASDVADLKSQITDVETLQRVSSLNTTHFAKGTSIEAVGIPVYVDDVTDYPQYGLTETGWYIFARVTAKDSITVSASTVVNGAAGYIAVVGNSYIDLAVKFGVAAMTQEVVINWGTYTDTLLFKATDLALRNMDYRSTYYEYNIGDYATWTFALTADETFVRYKHYYTLEDGEYVPAEVVYGDPVTPDTYYVHTKVRFEGMPRNITYVLDDIIDCPVEIVLPAIEDNGYGAWFELKLNYNGQYSLTLIPPEGVHLSNDNVVKQTAGINVLDLHYNTTGGVKVWRLINTHTGFPETRELVSVEFRTPPTKTVYVAGETLDLTGVSIVATYSDGAKREVTNENSDADGGSKTTFTPANGTALSAGNTTLTVTHRYMKGHATLDKTLTATIPLTVS